MAPDKPALTVAEAAEAADLTGFGRDTISRMFERELGVLVLDRPEAIHKRSYRSIRILRPVYERVSRRLAV